MPDDVEAVPPPPTSPPPPAGRPSRPIAWRTVLVAAIVAAAVATTSAVGVVELRGAERSSSTPGAAEAEPAALPTAATDGTALSVREVAELVSPSVASVEVTVVGGPGGQGAAAGSGSAVILTEDGYLLTNDHVVAGASDVSVTLADGTRHEATVVGADATSDLAVLQVDATGLPAATFADGPPEVGDTAIAIGSPFGLDGSVTAGIVSALERTLAGGASTLTGLIQTDAAINPGNSGGALVDVEGRILGINTAIYSSSGANDGVGFAVPASTATAVAEQLIDGEEVRWPVLGISGQDVDANLAEAYGLGAESGALVGEVVPGSGADTAGLEPGDIVIEVDGATVDAVSDLVTTLRAHEVGDTVAVVVVRDGERRTLDVTLGAG